MSCLCGNGNVMVLLIVLFVCAHVFPGLFAWQGLGRSEQGSTENIKVKAKNNKLGLGTSVNNEVRNHSYYFLFELLYFTLCFFCFNLLLGDLCC